MNPSREPALRLREFKTHSGLSERVENSSPNATKRKIKIFVSVFQAFSFGCVFFVATKKMNPAGGPGPAGFSFQNQHSSRAKPRGRGPERRHTLLSCHKRVCRKRQLILSAVFLRFSVATHQQINSRPKMSKLINGQNRRNTLGVSIA